MRRGQSANRQRDQTLEDRDGRARERGTSLLAGVKLPVGALLLAALRLAEDRPDDPERENDEEVEVRGNARVVVVPGIVRARTPRQRRRRARRRRLLRRRAAERPLVGVLLVDAVLGAFVPRARGGARVASKRRVRAGRGELDQVPAAAGGEGGGGARAAVRSRVSERPTTKPSRDPTRGGLEMASEALGGTFDSSAGLARGRVVVRMSRRFGRVPPRTFDLHRSKANESRGSARRGVGCSQRRRDDDRARDARPVRRIG